MTQTHPAAITIAMVAVIYLAVGMLLGAVFL